MILLIVLILLRYNEMATKTQIEILKLLISSPEKPLTIRGIARALHKSYTLVYNNLASLEKEKIIASESVPPARIITLNPFAPSEMLIDIEQERKREFLKKYPWAQVMLEDALSAAKDIFLIVMVFGSYAKGKETPKSDIDLLIVVDEKRKISSMEGIFQNIYTKIKKGVHVVDADNFKVMIKNSNELNIGNEAKKHHIIMYGAEAYYQLLKNAGVR